MNFQRFKSTVVYKVLIKSAGSRLKTGYFEFWAAYFLGNYRKVRKIKPEITAYFYMLATYSIRRILS